MAIETVTREGDFVIRGGGRDMLRIHCTEDSMIITATELPQRQVIICTIEEAEELRDWLTRRIEEPV